MYELLNKLLRIYPKAKIVISGYYPIISEDSNGLTDAIKALYPISQFPTSVYKKLDDPVQLSKLSTKSDAFYRDSNLGLLGAVLRANRESGKDRIAFARITFPSDKCYGTDNSWLWKIEGNEGNYKTNDDKYYVRASLSQNTLNRLAAVAHPNVEGAGEYNRSIVQKVIETWPDWLNPTVLVQLGLNKPNFRL
jgi:hypothetical protein